MALAASALSSYCNWSSLPDQLLQSALSSSSQQPSAATDADAEAQLLPRFLQHLVGRVPYEFAVLQQPVFASGAKLQATMHARGVGTATGLMCWGGLQAGSLQAVTSRSDAAWIKEAQPWGQQPDYSKVWEAVPSEPSRAVIRVSPRSISAAARLAGSSSSSRVAAPAWVAEPCSPGLTGGLLGHSVVLWGSRAFLFGGMRTSAAAAAGGDGGDGTGKLVQRTCNVLQAYAVDAAGTQDGLLPVLTEPVPQFGDVPGPRTYHSAAVDAEGGVMWVHGGVRVREHDGSRVPADSEAGLLHAFSFPTYTWSQLQTTGSQRPSSTTLLAFFWHAGALWAIPDRPLPSSSSSSSSSRRGAAAAAGYQLLRLDVDAREWRLVETQGEGPSHRCDACAVWHAGNQELLVYGGRTAATPSTLLSDVHVLQLQATPPAWQAVRPKLLPGSGSGAGAAGTSQQQQQQQGGGMLPLAGHVGGAVGSSGDVVFLGGYSRLDQKQPQAHLQVLTKGVKPPTPDAAKAAGVGHQQALALQHVRLQLARLVKQAYPKQVALKPDGGGGVKLPARLLSLYSCLFDDLFQGMLQDEDDEEGGGGGDTQLAGDKQQQRQQQVVVPEVPVPGAALESVAAVCRWMVGLLSLAGCSVKLCCDMYRVADRLVVETLMVEALDELRCRALAPDEAAAVMALAGDLRFDAALGASAEQQLRQQITPATAPAIMALAVQHRNQQLQARCVEVMTAARKNDVWGVLAFACRFSCRVLQGSCLGFLRFSSRGILLDRAERIVQAASRHLLPGQALSDAPVVGMLENDLVQEVEAEGLGALLGYVAACDKLHLPRLRAGIVAYVSRPAVWRQLHQEEGHKHLLQQLQRRHAQLWASVIQRVQNATR